MKKLPKIFKSACKLTVWTLLDHIMPKEAFFLMAGPISSVPSTVFISRTYYHYYRQFF